MMKTHTIFDIRLDDLGDEELREKLKDFLQGSDVKTIVTPNPEFLLASLDDPSFKDVLLKADLSLPDGVGLAYAVAALSDDVLAHRHTGLELLPVLAGICAENGKRLLLLGGSGKDPDKVGELLKKTYPTLNTIACDPGIVDDEYPRLSEATVSRLQAMKPDVVAVALGQGRGRVQGKQEKIMEYLKTELPTVRILVGVGGAIHTIANPHLQAPKAWKTIGLEWLWRLLYQPWRAKRVFRATVVFPLEVIWATIRGRRFFKAVKNVFAQMKRQFSKV